MHGSIPAKIARLGLHLVIRPVFLWRYLSTLPAWGRSPVEIGLPWISFPAIDFLTDYVNKDSSVFEWGSGGSTVFFARRAGWVVSVENDINWHARVRDAAVLRGRGNLDLRLAPFDSESATALESSDYLAAVRERQWDLIMVDGVLGCGSGGEFGKHRPRCFKLAEENIRPGGVIVVDDIWMFPELLASHRA